LSKGRFRKDHDLYVTDTATKGRGLFTHRAWRKGDIVLIVKGKTRYFQATTPEECYQYPNWFAVNKNTWVDPNAPYVYLNHSCNPSLGIFYGRIFIATRDIAPGEELTFDYSTTEDELDWEMRCHCQEATCRGVIRSVQHLAPHHYERIQAYTPPYFCKVYEMQQITPK